MSRASAPDEFGFHSGRIDGARFPWDRRSRDDDDGSFWLGNLPTLAAWRHEAGKQEIAVSVVPVAVKFSSCGKID